MTFESQHFDESFTPTEDAWTQRSKTFTFSGNIVSVLNLEVWLGHVYTGRHSVIVDDVVISATDVTVYYKYYVHTTADAYASIDICVEY